MAVCSHPPQRQPSHPNASEHSYMWPSSVSPVHGLHFLDGFFFFFFFLVWGAVSLGGVLRTKYIGAVACSLAGPPEDDARCPPPPKRPRQKNVCPAVCTEESFSFGSRKVPHVLPAAGRKVGMIDVLRG
jgi:hypothetical protein